MKHRIPVTERIISKILSDEVVEPIGEIEQQRLVFKRADGTIVFEQEDLFSKDSEYGLRSYFIYAEEYKFREESE